MGPSESIEKMKNLLIIFGLLTIFYACHHGKESDPAVQHTEKVKRSPQDELHQKVFKELELNDSLLFDLGFNQCDTNQIRNLVSEDFEFYHDQAGITGSKKSFIESIAGLCNLDYKPIRKLDLNTLEVNLLKTNGKLYGALQKGKHEFYAKENNKPLYLTSTADFIHLWILENGEWKLKRVISYNHQEPKE